MATTETWVLDGLTISSGNYSILELNVDPPKERPDWITAADSEGATLMRSPLHENRTITMKLRVAQQASMDTALDQVAAVRDKLRKASLTQDGVALVWTAANSARSVTFDVIDGEIPEMPISLDGQSYSWWQQRPIFTVAMTAKPYWRAPEVLTSTSASSTPITTLEIANVPGDVPALGRLIVSDTAAQNRRHMEWGLEGRSYNSGTSLIVDSDNMTLTGTVGAQATVTGAYDPNATGNNAISATVGPVQMAIAKTGNLSHVGTFRVKARLWYSGATFQNAYASFSWQATGGEYATNPPASFPAGGWCDVDLGLITIPAAASGTQQWSGIVTAWLPAGTAATFETVSLDYLLLIPVDEGYGKARAVFTYTSAPVIARDNFEGMTPAAVLNARVAPVGGTWATSGAAGDFQASASMPGSSASIGTNWGGGMASPRFAVLGATNYTDVAVQATVNGNYGQNEHIIVIARWTDSSNYVYAEDYQSSLWIKQVVAGATTILASEPMFLVGSQSYNIRLTVFATGRVIAQALEPSGAAASFPLEARSTALATGGTLATGKPGFAYQNQESGTRTIYFDNFYVSTPQAEPVVIYSGRTLEVRYDDTLRQDSTGVYYGKPSSYRGTRFTLPTGTSRVAVKARRNDTDATLEDVVTDSTTIQVGYQKRGLVVPR